MAKVRSHFFLFVKPLNSLAHYLGLFPYYEPNCKPRIILYRIYCVVLIIAIVSAFILATYGLIKDGKNADLLIYTISMIGYFLQTVGAVVSVVLTAFKNADSVKPFLMGLYSIDTESKSSRWKFLLKLTLTHIYVIAMIIYDGFSFSQIIGLYNFLTQYLLKRVEFYFNVVLVFLVQVYTDALNYRFEKLNRDLEAQANVCVISPYPKNPFRCGLLITVSNKEAYLRLLKLRETYTQLSKLVLLFNKMFGWQIFFFVMNICMFLLELLAREFTTSNGVFMRIRRLLFTAVFVIMGVVVAVGCDRTTKEAQRTATICYDLLLKLPALHDNYQDKILREELILLAQQATHQCPYFSAAGFFKVDYTMLFGFLGTVTSYVIVLIQINK